MTPIRINKEIIKSLNNSYTCIQLLDANKAIVDNVTNLSIKIAKLHNISISHAEHIIKNHCMNNCIGLSDVEYEDLKNDLKESKKDE